MGEQAGVRAAVADLLDEAPAPVIQSSLFPAELVHELDKPRPEQLRQRDRAGRPPGARNKRTAEFRAYVLARAGGQHPVDGLIETYARPVAILAAELGCTPLEAFDRQMACRRIVLEYVEGKMPVSVDLGDRAGIAVIFGDLPADDSAQETDDFQGVTIDGAG